jgi:hypothetical protein
MDMKVVANCLLRHINLASIWKAGSGMANDHIVRTKCGALMDRNFDVPGVSLSEDKSLAKPETAGRKSHPLYTSQKRLDRYGIDKVEAQLLIRVNGLEQTPCVTFDSQQTLADR